MKILIVGKNSYISKCFVESAKFNKPDWSYDFVSVRGDDWLSYDYSDVDAIIYFAAIVHHPEITDKTFMIM
jgi:hypothetical protein